MWSTAGFLLHGGHEALRQPSTDARDVGIVEVVEVFQEPYELCGGAQGTIIVAG
jgi:hypothetical protein